uniref:C-type lectin domain-containing protein n=1 Tax=Sander lucioperca TaxID=283035 RepID=A0A8C9ZTB6_SANLU
MYPVFWTLLEQLGHICLLLKSYLYGNLVELLRGNCPMFWFSFNGRCYKYVATRLTWADAELHCVSQGGNLVSIHSLEEENFIKSLIKNFDHAQGFTWIGLSDIHKEGNTWFWSDGSVVDYSFWNAGEPNNSNGNENCVCKGSGTKLRWNDGCVLNQVFFVLPKYSNVECMHFLI